ncbi:MAG: signal peptidase I [Lachnospiraceae bacterium]|nr:signal peptidase I [Lachnospiraceae bacterium]
MAAYSGKRKRGLQFYHKQKKVKKGLVSLIVECVIIALIVGFVAYVLVRLLGMKTVMVGSSMEPELENAQEVFVNRFVYVISSPKRGDVIAFLPNGNEKTHYYIKRVIGLPGETVQIKNGKVYINGTVIDEKYEFDYILEAGLAENEITLGNEEFFVLGDMRNISEDSRSGNIGAVKKEDIYGKVWYKKKTQTMKAGFVSR